ncbi:AfsR/SARP family transcriptional regulator [Kineococcus sp. SYSU DK003]|uniref:AfsR/SARP family transcriptional regulator n=1 Tax=Kineococcus sp. SYSU DK003 TaxID=3383124 RepID=UPI003D7CB665
MAEDVEVEVLGPVRLLVGGRPVPVPGVRRRAVLAVLALARGRAVTVDHLLDVAWPRARPGSGRPAVHNHVSRLRGHLGPAARRLQTLDGAYRLTLEEDALDAARARRLLRRARAGARADQRGAVSDLREALALWRGPALADLQDVPAVAAATVGLDRLRWEITELLVHTALASGEVDGTTDLAAEAVEADPLAEPGVRLLVETLAVTGRAASALQTARDYRRRLAEEAGLAATGALDELERAVAGGTLGPGRCPWCGR